MESPISPIVADIFMDNWERNALSKFDPTPTIWWRYVDDTITVLISEQIDGFFRQINTVTEAFQFTYETDDEGKLGILDGKIKKE